MHFEYEYIEPEDEDENWDDDDWEDDDDDCRQSHVLPLRDKRPIPPSYRHPAVEVKCEMSHRQNAPPGGRPPEIGERVIPDRSSGLRWAGLGRGIRGGAPARIRTPRRTSPAQGRRRPGGRTDRPNEATLRRAGARPAPESSGRGRPRTPEPPARCPRSRKGRGSRARARRSGDERLPARRDRPTSDRR